MIVSVENARVLREPNASRDGILPPHAVDADVASHLGVAHCLLASKMTWFGVPIAVDDFLADVHGEMGLVLACMSLDTELCILLETWEKLHVVAADAWMCKREGTRSLIYMGERHTVVKHATVWSRHTVDKMLVLF